MLAPPTRRTLFVCPPTYFDVVYSINPWMDPTVPVDRPLAWRQWRRLVRTLAALGERVVAIDPAPGCPDMVFLGDAGVVVGDRFLCSRFRHPERAPEADHYATWFAAAGYEVVRLPGAAVLEGLGDVAIGGRRAVLGHGPRSNAAGLAALRGFAPFLEVVAEVDLPDPRFYHLAMAVVFLDEDTLLYYPGALTAAGVRALERAVPDAIAVDERDIIAHQACNCVVLDEVVLLDGCSPALRDQLERRGRRVQISPASEFKKGGGSLRCLVLPSLTPPVAMAATPSSASRPAAASSRGGRA
jgi:N-dimethylarginine dimethylaminohydrolase